MEVTNVTCRAWYLSGSNITLNVYTTATVDFNDGEGPKPMYCNFDYVPTEWPDDALVTDHEGDPQPVLLQWLNIHCSTTEDWTEIDPSEV